MPRDLISRYVWIVDMLNRYGRLSRRQLNDLWMRSAIGDGQPIPERTFFHYRRAIEENFHIEILCSHDGRYYIDQDATRRNQAYTNWLLDSFAVNSALKDAPHTQGRVEVEDVPSAREYLPAVLDAIGTGRSITFTYAGFSRSRPEKDILFSPYFVKRYKQRWYMIGLRVKSDDIRTYALDRVQGLSLTELDFTMPDDFNPAEYFEHIVGITQSKGAVRQVRIQTTPQQAKYLRALPLHPSQQEEVGDNGSVFTYRLKLNYELVHELLSYGSSLKVLAPRELRLMPTEELRQTLANYPETANDEPKIQPTTRPT